MRLFLLIICISFLELTQLFGQNFSPFQAGITLGMNVSQVDGDEYSGYRKIGLQAGIQGIANISDNLFISTEFLFSQRGASPSNKEKLESFENFIDIRLNYIEVPFLINVRVGKKRDDFRTLRIFGGVSIGRLIGSNIDQTGESLTFYPFLNMEEIVEDFESFDFSLVLGFQRNFSKNLGLFFKHTLTLNDLYVPVGEQNPYNNLEPFHFTLGASYLIY
ncbi:MAG: porin family protein [Bacteroidota bacterium]